MEEGERIILTDRLEIDIIELPKLSITEEKENEDLMNWLYFIENPENERVVEKMKENKELKQAKEELEKMSQDEYMQKIAELREKAILDEKSLYNTGYSDGIQEMEKKMQEMAKKMKSKKLPIELNEIKKIANRINSRNNWIIERGNRKTVTSKIKGLNLAKNVDTICIYAFHNSTFVDFQARNNLPHHKLEHLLLKQSKILNIQQQNIVLNKVLLLQEQNLQNLFQKD